MFGKSIVSSEEKLFAVFILQHQCCVTQWGCMLAPVLYSFFSSDLLESKNVTAIFASNTALLDIFNSLATIEKTNIYIYTSVNGRLQKSRFEVTLEKSAYVTCRMCMQNIYNIIIPQK